MSDESSKPKRRRKPPWILGGVVVLLLTLLVLLQSSNLWKTFTVTSASDTVLLYALSSLNFVAFFILGFILIRSLLKLRQERKALQLGSKLKTRLLIYFFAISLLPLIAMAGFSYLFMNRALERWFSQMPENVVRAEGKVQEFVAESEKKRLTETVNMLAESIGNRDTTNDELESLLKAGDLARIEILSQEGVVIAESQANAAETESMNEVVRLVRAGNFEAEELSDGRGYDAAISDLSGGRKLVIVPSAFERAEAVDAYQESLRQFDLLKSQQISVRQIGITTLGLLTFLLIFASSWMAFYVARGLTRPIRALAEGAGEIARGNLSHRVDVLAEDELELLVKAFNGMSAELEGNSNELRERRRYIETVLQSLSTGVISFDGSNKVTTINKAAIQMLRLEDADFRGLGLDELVNRHNREILERLLARASRIGYASDQTELKREQSEDSDESSAGLTVALTASALPGGNGTVLVIEDLSELIAAQRAFAWQEVARRMAHEIKNPLTPIQLSAERIAKRLEKDMDGARGLEGVEGNGGDRRGTSKVVRDGTATILREVASLKTMVDEFSRFARLPDVKPESSDINELLRKVAHLYEDRTRDVDITLKLANSIPDAMIDDEQMKRVFVNLIDNSLEAFGDEQDAKTVTVQTRHDAARDMIVAEVSDNGKGIAPSDFQRLFQPYFSTKGRGTGLGLAIVQRIVTEHGGKIKAVGNQPAGAKFIVELPVASTNGGN
ncbi:MAG: HAMP domain-containing protein [Acidobacteria bacterium]|nr:MAG: HAMP domain-containing protein [Acidobacteriota bacterium]REK02292.1 MAG: HAMP domain-containing protein [Acidobacteriota bacterium]REK13905.1 MAG: HAMP domain-containing protein [Acidobacteriota bacterium]REK41899.1 MAG: HAMP domain-containing protein [Acidobacteriota bacterium]